MNDNQTNHPRDHTVALGDTSPEVRAVAETFLIMLASHQVTSLETQQFIVNSLCKTCFYLGLKAGEAKAYREIALQQATAQRPAESPQLHIVTANKAEINEAPPQDDSRP